MAKFDIEERAKSISCVWCGQAYGRQPFVAGGPALCLVIA